MIVSLMWPDKALWPNGGTPNRFVVSKAKKAARHAASWATIAARTQQGLPDLSARPLPITIKVYAKAKGPLPDRDNIVSSLKVQLDAIAEQIGVNDRDFAAPVVVFAEPRVGRIEVIVGAN